jgi:hypothetical protein
MMQLAEAGIPAWQFLADAIGKSIPDAMKLAENGAISASVGINAVLTGMQKQFGGMMQVQSTTLGGLWSTLKDTASAVLRKIADEIVKRFNLKEKMQQVITWLDSQTSRIIGWFTNIAAAAANLASGTAKFVQGLLGLNITADSITKGIDRIIEAFYRIGDWWDKNGAKIGNWLNTLAQALVLSVRVAVAEIRNVVTSVWQAMENPDKWRTRPYTLKEKLEGLSPSEQRRRFLESAAMNYGESSVLSGAQAMKSQLAGLWGQLSNPRFTPSSAPPATSTGASKSTLGDWMKDGIAKAEAATNAQKSAPALQAEAEAAERLRASTDTYAATLADIEIKYRKNKAELEASAAGQDITNRLALIQLDRANEIKKATADKAEADKQSAAVLQKALNDELDAREKIAIAKAKNPAEAELLTIQAEAARRKRELDLDPGTPKQHQAQLELIEAETTQKLNELRDKLFFEDKDRQEKRIGILQDAQRRIIRLAYGETAEKLYLLDIEEAAKRKEIENGLQDKQEQASAIAAMEQDLANQREAIMGEEEKKREDARQKWLDEQRQGVRMTSIEDLGRNAMIQAAQLRFPGGGNAVQENTRRTADTLDSLKGQLDTLTQAVGRQQTMIDKVLNPSPIRGGA